MAKILIVGCGDVGGRVAAALAGRGHEIYGLRRSAFSIPGVHALRGDVCDAASLQFPAGLDYVFIALSPDVAGEDAYRRVYLDGTRNVLAALDGQRLRHVFLVSSTSVYGDDDGRMVNEESVAVPGSASARLLLDMEQSVAGGGWPATVVRFAGIYGPGRLRLVHWVQSGRPVQSEPPAWTNRIHVEDCAGMLVFLFEQAVAGTILASVYIGTDDRPAPQHEVLDWLADALGLPRVAHEIRPGGGGNKRLSNRRISALGYRFRFPGYPEGYRAVMGLSDKIR